MEREMIEKFIKFVTSNAPVFNCIYQGGHNSRNCLFITFSVPKGCAKEWGSIFLSFWLNNYQAESLAFCQSTASDCETEPMLKASDLSFIWSSINHPWLKEFSVKVRSEEMVVTINDSAQLFLKKDDKLFMEFNQLFPIFIQPKIISQSQL